MWFAASLLFVSEHTPTGDKPSIWEENILLIEAPDLAAARATAENLGAEPPLCYESATGDQVCWRFYGVDSVSEISPQSFSTGTELFSRFLSDSEVQTRLAGFDEDE